MSWDTDVAKRNVIASRKAKEITQRAARELWKELEDTKYANPARAQADKLDDFWRVQERLKAEEEVIIKPIDDVEADETFIRLIKQNTLKAYIFEGLLPVDIIDSILRRKKSAWKYAEELLVKLRGSHNDLIEEDSTQMQGSFAARRKGEPNPDPFASTNCWCWPRLLALREAGPRNPYWAVEFRASGGNFREATALDGDPFYWRQGGRTCVPRNGDATAASCGACTMGVCGAVSAHPMGVREVIAIGIKAKAIGVDTASSIYDVLKECKHPSP